MGLSQKHSVAVLVRTTELFGLFVELLVFSELLLCGERLVASLQGAQGR